MGGCKNTLVIASAWNQPGRAGRVRVSSPGSVRRPSSLGHDAKEHGRHQGVQRAWESSEEGT